MGLRKFALGTIAALIASTVSAHAQTPQCDRTCLNGMVDGLLASIRKHDPETLPLAPIYAATENGHPAALGMMAAWRTIGGTGRPSLVALDPTLGQAYFALDVDEGGQKTVLWGRLKVVDRKITEIELFLNRDRGDHGFSYSPEQLPANYAKLMSPPASRTRASREELTKLALASFDASDPLSPKIAADCQFTELGWQVVDPGLDDVPPPAAPAGAKPRDPNSPLGCMFPPFRPNDRQARVIAIDENLGFVVVAGLVPGHVYPYPYYGKMISAFIPDDMKQAGGVQDEWMKRHVARGGKPIVRPEPAVGETMQVFQYYNGQMQASQINVYLTAPGGRSVWVSQ